MSAGDGAAASHGGVATSNRAYAVALGRAFAGALIFGLPLLMTMEVWWLGFEMDRTRLLAFVAADLALLFGLSHVAGFEESHSWLDDVLDAFAAFFVAALTAAAVLWLIGALTLDHPLDEIAGKIAVQAVPGSFGAMIGAKLLGEGEEIDEHEPWRETYSGQLFLMAAGALFLSFTVAPTEEVYLIAYRMSAWQSLALVALSIALLHALVYNVGLPREAGRRLPTREAMPRFTLPGYGIAVLMCVAVLWAYGRIDVGAETMAATVAVLAFPAALGAAIGRVVI